MRKSQNSGKGNSIDWGAILPANREQIQIELPEPEPMVNYWIDADTITTYLKSKKIRTHTAEFYEKEITAFGNFLDALGLTEATVNECNSYLVARRDKVSPGSARVIRGVLGGYGSYLAKVGMIPENPFAKTSEKELGITRQDSEEASKKAKGLYRLEDVAQILLAISRGDEAALIEIIH